MALVIDDAGSVNETAFRSPELASFSRYALLAESPRLPGARRGHPDKPAAADNR